jgi:hypothetical protein
MILLTDYWMGRDWRYGSEITPRIRSNAMLTVECANRLLEEYAKATLDDTPRHVNSGWRPAAVNAGVPNAAKRSKHMTGEAIDLSDDDGSLDAWCISAVGLDALARCGLWLEHPGATPRWTHFQTVPPRSGKRVFWP